MRLLIQKVNEAKVLVSGKVVGKINKGLLIFLGVDIADTDDDISWLVKKTMNLRIFNDSNDIMNLSRISSKSFFLILIAFEKQTLCHLALRSKLYFFLAKLVSAIPNKCLS